MRYIKARVKMLSKNITTGRVKSMWNKKADLERG